MSASQSPRADLYFSVVLTLVGAAAVFESWRMPRLENLGIDPLTAPGVTPALVGGVLTLLGLMLFVRSLAAVGAARPAAEGGWGRFAVTLGLCLAYALGLVGRVPFWLATALFVAVFVLVFTWDRARALRRIAIAVGLAVATAAAVTYLFQSIFLVRLP